MKRQLIWSVGLLASVFIALPGCLFPKRDFTFDEDLAHCQAVATRIEYPCAHAPYNEDLLCEQRPRTLGDPEPEYWDMTLEEAVYLALTTSDVVRTLGGAVFRAPGTLRTAYNPAIRESDPQFGVEGALSAFDAQFSSTLFFEKNDRKLNNEFNGELGFFEQDYDVFGAQLTKRAATGSRFTLRKSIDFDNNNNIGQQFPQGAWTVKLDAEARHPLLQGGGLNFNRIAGPDASPGISKGVLIARVNTDVSLVEFEAGIRDFISEVEHAYWRLYAQYHVLDARIKARNASLETWRSIHALYQAGRRGGEAYKESQAREQYRRFEGAVQDALVGIPGDPSGATGGVYASLSSSGAPGVHLYERGLRFLIGLPTNGDRLIRPIDEPSLSPVVFPWETIVTEALVRRPELRRQRWQIKRRELELIASKNFLLPNLDLVGRYRWRGFGERLIDSSGNGTERFDNAYTNLTDGDFQEWQLGVEFSVPIGFRQGHAAVQNAELRLARARAVLEEQERLAINFLSTAVAEKDRAYKVMQTDYNRLLAAKKHLTDAQAAYDHDQIDLIVLLDAQRRHADAEEAYYALQAAYARALKNVHYHKGSLLAYCGVGLSEGAWPSKAYHDASQRERLRGRCWPINYSFNHPPIVARRSCP
ncbi:TolC family protein [Planctomycetota bacterium]